MNRDFSTTVKEITGLIQGTDLYRRMYEVTKAGHHNDSTLLQKIADGINSHYLSRLHSHSLAGKRTSYLLELIESELSYYEHPK